MPEAADDRSFIPALRRWAPAQRRHLAQARSLRGVSQSLAAGRKEPPQQTPGLSFCKRLPRLVPRRKQPAPVPHDLELTNLRSLDLPGTDVDEIAAQELRRSLPNASILVNPIWENVITADRYRSGMMTQGPELAADVSAGH